jgi:hypothetical protein
MKKIKLIVAVAIILCVSCNEQDLLNEVPLSFYSPENSYTRPDHFEQAITYIYSYTRTSFFGDEDKRGYSLIGGSDYLKDCRNDGSFSMGDYRNFTPGNCPSSLYWWQKLYSIILNANIILNRIDPIDYASKPNDKTEMIAEARFFRGFSYRGLANLFGGVPITVNEVQSVKLDFVRATRQDTWQQAANDLLFAAENLPEKKNVKAVGRVNRSAAYHFLAEVYLSLNKPDSAIWAANKVLNNPDFGLMTKRFGSRKSDAGNAYWDLFQMKNQNLAENKEAIWVAQFEVDEPGRLGMGTHKPERMLGPAYWELKDAGGNYVFIGPTTQNGGRGAGYLGPTDYFMNDIWLSDWNNDQRNQEPNMIRDYKCDNPFSIYYGKSVSEIPLSSDGTDRLMKYFCFPTMSKRTQRGDHPDFLLGKKTDAYVPGLTDEQAAGLLTSSARKCYHDWYYARVSETYLLRAEAYLAKGMKKEAADDINEVRARVNAGPVAEADVTIDYILDERLRELAYEEPRMMTLGRLGKICDRVKRCSNGVEGTTVAEHNNLFPIPFDEIQRNTDAVLEQNPGYVN